MKRKILVADDEALVRAAILGVLTELADAFEVCAEASNGRAMVDLARKHLPDLFLVDIKMPEMGGLEAIRECQRVVPDAGFLILSGVNDFADARTALQLGVADYLLKPIRPAELVQAVQEAGARLEERRQRQVDSLALRCADWRQRPSAAWEDPLPGWRFSALWLFLDESAVPGAGAGRADGLRDRIRSVVGQRLGTGFLPVLLPGGRAGVGLVWALRFDLPNAERFEADLLRQVSELVVPFRTGALVTGVRLGPQALLADLMRQIQGMEAEPTQRFAFLGDPGWTDWTVYQASGPDPWWPPVLRCCEGLASALPTGDLIEFRSHLQALRRADPASRGSDPLLVRVRRYLHGVFGLPNEAEPSAWADLLASRVDLWFGSEGTPEPASENQVVAHMLKMVAEEAMFEISIKQISGRLGLSANYLSTLFHRQTGTTFVRYLTQARMDRAVQLIKEPQVPLHEVARLCGYANRSYFEKVFLATQGLSPGDYRARTLR